MKILIDECLPKNISKEFHNHFVKTVREMGWDSKSNGALMDVAINAGFEVFVTVDKKDLDNHVKLAENNWRARIDR